MMINEPLGFLKRAFSHFGEPSSKRLIAGGAAFTLCLGFLAMIEAISYQAHKNWAIAFALVSVVTVLGGSIAWLARRVFLKPDAPENVGVEAPPAPVASQIVPEALLGDGGAK